MEALPLGHLARAVTPWSAGLLAAGGFSWRSHDQGTKR